MTETQVFVVIPVHNRRDVTLTCLDCLAKQTYGALRVVVVDDGSTDGTAAAVSTRHPDVHLLHGDGSLWWAGATNLGLRWCLPRAQPTDYVLTLNDDTTCTPGYVSRLVATARAFPDSLVGSTAVDGRDGNKIIDAGSRMHWMTARQDFLDRGRSIADVQRELPLVRDVDVLSGRGTLIPVAVFRRVGLYDARRLPQYSADYEFSRRAARAGFRLRIDRGATVLTIRNPNGESPVGARITARNVVWALSSRRSGMNPWYHLQYARLACPRLALPSYVVCYFWRSFLWRVFRRLHVRRRAAGQHR